MHDVGDALVRAGFAAPVLDVERYTLSYTDVRGLTADLKAMGARNAAAGRLKGLTSPRKFAAMQAAYEAYRSGGRLPATCEVVFAQAWVPREHPRAARQRARHLARVAAESIGGAARELTEPILHCDRPLIAAAGNPRRASLAEGA